MLQEYSLSSDQTTIITRAANEGIPVGAIARVLTQPFTAVYEALRQALAVGQIGEIPSSDWPPGGKWGCRFPTVPRVINADDVEFEARQRMRLTPLEAGFMMVLLRFDHADKDKLHAVVEAQRQKRALRPDKQELTDKKIVDVIICKLRKKLVAHNENFILKTAWGSGYFFEQSVKKAILAFLGVPDDAAAA